MVVWPKPKMEWLNSFAIPKMFEVGDLECVLWPWATTEHGYPLMKKVGLVTRAILGLYEGPPPTPEHHAAHCPIKCTSNRCINVFHLRWATPAENMADKKRRVR